jgi:hypothetical protein
MTTVFGKIALVAAMAIGTLYFGDMIDLEKGPCDNPNSFDCCYYQCTHDPGSGCNGSGSCCNNQCR